MSATVTDKRVLSHADLACQAFSFDQMCNRFGLMTREERDHHASFLTTVLELYASSGFIKPVATITLPVESTPPVAETSQPTKTEDTWSVVASRQTESPKTQPKTQPKTSSKKPSKPQTFNIDEDHKIKLTEEAIKFVKEIDLVDTKISVIIANLEENTDNSKTRELECYKTQLMFQICVIIANEKGFKTVVEKFDISNVRTTEALVKTMEGVKPRDMDNADFACKVMNALLEKELIFFDKAYRFMDCTFKYIYDICKANGIELNKNNGAKFVEALKAQCNLGPFPLLDDIVTMCFNRSFEKLRFGDEETGIKRPFALLADYDHNTEWFIVNKSNYMERTPDLVAYVELCQLGNLIEALHLRGDVDKIQLEYLDLLYSITDSDQPDECRAFFYHFGTKHIGARDKARAEYVKAAFKVYPNLSELIIARK